MIKRFALTAAFVLAAGMLAHARQSTPQTPPTPATPAASAAPSIAGKWNLSVETQSGPNTSVLDLKLDGKKVTGTVSSQLGEAGVQGEFGEGKLTFSIAFQGANGNFQLGFAGALRDDGTLAGTMDIAGQGMQMPWKAERIKTDEPKTEAKAVPSPSIAGKWNVVVTTQNGPNTSVLDVKVDGKKVTGTMSSQLGETPVAGEFAEGKLTFAIAFQSANGPVQIAFAGALKDDGTMAGTIDFAGQMQMPWTAERVK
jgi:hypothetical protein